MSFRTMPKLIAENAEAANGDSPCDMHFKPAVACLADDTIIWSELALASVDDYAAFAALARRLAVERRIDLRVALASTLAAWTTVVVLVARARRAADAKTARRLERERTHERDALIALLHRIDDETDIDTGDLIDELLSDETPAEAILVD